MSSVAYLRTCSSRGTLKIKRERERGGRVSSDENRKSAVLSLPVVQYHRVFPIKGKTKYIQ